MSDEEVSDDDELQWRLSTLIGHFKQGKIKIAEHLGDDLQQSLAAVRYRPDGKVDLQTVDGTIRSMALMTGFMTERNATKDSISLEEISHTYFDFIAQNFSFLADEAQRKKYNAHQFAKAVSKNPLAVKDLAPQIPGFIEAIEEFWTTVSTASHNHIQDLDTSKAVFGGDLFPSFTRNIASAVGLYIDTIILSCPFWQSRHIFQLSSKEMQVYYLVKHAINLLQYKQLATTALAKPILLISPLQSSVDGPEKDFIFDLAQRDAVKHAEVLFDREFDDFGQLMEFGEKLNTVEEAISAVSKLDRLLFDTAWEGLPEEQLRRALENDLAVKVGGDHPGRHIASQCFSRMAQATDILHSSQLLGGTPLIDAPTSWEYYKWKLEYIAPKSPLDQTSLHMTKGLQNVSNTDAEWLGRIPSEALIEMRQQGAFEEIRSVLSEGVNEIANTKPDAFFRSSDRIVDNIRAAFEQHKCEIDNLRSKKIKFAGQDLGAWLVSGAVEVAAIASGSPVWGSAGFVTSQLVSAPKLKDIPPSFKALYNKDKKIKTSPMGLLFKHIDAK